MRAHDSTFDVDLLLGGAVGAAPPPSRKNVARESSEMSETSSERIARLLRCVAAPAEPGEHVTHAIARAARRLGWDRGRTKRLWYREARRVDADEMEAVRRYLKEAQDEHARLTARIERLEAILIQDADSHRAQADARGRAPRSPDSPMDR